MVGFVKSCLTPQLLLPAADPKDENLSGDKCLYLISPSHSFEGEGEETTVRSVQPPTRDWYLIAKKSSASPTHFANYCEGSSRSYDPLCSATQQPVDGRLGTGSCKVDSREASQAKKQFVQGTFYTDAKSRFHLSTLGVQGRRSGGEEERQLVTIP